MTPDVLRRIARIGRTMVAAARDTALRSVAAITPSRPLEGGPEVLEAEYRAGTWDYLSGDSELARFGVVAVYCLRFGAGGRILEIGCGEGLLAERLDAARLTQFVGVDVSHTAVARAQARGIPGTVFVAADAASLTPDGRFDVIVFNEVLEYFEDPDAVVRRLGACLTPGGVLIVSQYDAPDAVRTRRIWRRLARGHRVVLATRISSGRRLRWNVKVLRPSPR